MCTEQVPTPLLNETVRQERGRDGTVKIEQEGDNASGQLSAQNVINERAGSTSQAKNNNSNALTRFHCLCDMDMLQFSGTVLWQRRTRS